MRSITLRKALVADAVAVTFTATLVAVPTGLSSAATEVDGARVTSVTSHAAAPYTP